MRDNCATYAKVVKGQQIYCHSCGEVLYFTPNSTMLLQSDINLLIKLDDNLHICNERKPNKYKMSQKCRNQKQAAGNQEQPGQLKASMQNDLTSIKQNPTSYRVPAGNVTTAKIVKATGIPRIDLGDRVRG